MEQWRILVEEGWHPSERSAVQLFETIETACAAMRSRCRDALEFHRIADDGTVGLLDAAERAYLDGQTEPDPESPGHRWKRGRTMTCEAVALAHVVPGWSCCACRTYNGNQRPACKRCGHERCDGVTPLPEVFPCGCTIDRVSTGGGEHYAEDGSAKER